ncbi:hypothetical protein ABK040_005947 [Willaertia magna]
MSFALLSISIAEFDILDGNTLSYTYPKTVQLEKYYPEFQIADKCIPDGGHIYSEDQTGIILPIDESNVELQEMLNQHLPNFKLIKTCSPSTPITNNNENSDNVSSNNVDISQQHQHYLYGSVFFRNKIDDRVRRGAIQKSILVVTTKPLFTLFTSLLRDTMEQISQCEEQLLIKYGEEGMNKEEKKNLIYNILEKLYNEMKDSIESANGSLTRKLNISLYDKVYQLKVPKLREDIFNGASLTDLVKLFEKHICYIWEALLFSRRLLFVGSPAKVVMMCCLSCPLLIYPLKGTSNRIAPYVTVGDPKLEEHTFICGMTNPILETSKTSWDYYASIAAGKVLYKRQKISLISKSEFKDFLKQVLTGIKHGKSESWVRDQFNQFNLNFLNHVPFSKKKSITQNFIHCPLYKRFALSNNSAISSVVGASFYGSNNSSPATNTNNTSSISGNTLTSNSLLFNQHLLHENSQAVSSSNVNNVRTLFSPRTKRTTPSLPPFFELNHSNSLETTTTPPSLLQKSLPLRYLKHTRSQSGDITNTVTNGKKISPRRVSIINFYRKINPFISSKNEIVFSQKDLIASVISDHELDILWPYLMPNSDQMLDWNVTGHVTQYNMSLCIKDDTPNDTFYSRHSGPLKHRYEKVIRNIHNVLNLLFKESDNYELIYTKELLLSLDRKTLTERERALLDIPNKNKRDSSFIYIKMEKPVEEELLVVNSEVKQTSYRSLFVHKVLKLQSDSMQFNILDNPEYFVYVVNRISEEETELTQVHVIRAANLSEKRDKYLYYNTALALRKVLIEKLEADTLDYSTITDYTSDDSSSEEEDDNIQFL